MSQRSEASVEEILDSIKKVIARDNREGSLAVRQQGANKGPPQSFDDEDGEEVFDLSEAELVEDGASAPKSVTDDDDAESDDEAGLITSSVRSSMQQNFAALSMLAEPGARPQIVRSGETSLEGMVREMLRPMLAEWLDKNLPEMVERLVKAEIARIARKRS